MAIPSVLPLKLYNDVDEALVLVECFELSNIIMSIFSCAKSDKLRKSVGDFTLLETVDNQNQDYLALILDKISKLPNGIQLLDSIIELSSIGISINPILGSTTHFFIGNSKSSDGIVVLEIINTEESKLSEYESLAKYLGQYEN